MRRQRGRNCQPCRSQPPRGKGHGRRRRRDVRAGSRARGRAGRPDLHLPRAPHPPGRGELRLRRARRRRGLGAAALPRGAAPVLRGRGRAQLARALASVAARGGRRGGVLRRRGRGGSLQRSYDGANFHFSIQTDELINFR